MRTYHYIGGFAIVLLIISCGGGGSSGSSSVDTTLIEIDTPAKAENTFYAIGRNSEDFYALTGWSEMVLETLNNKLVESNDPPAKSPYKDLMLPCPVKGTMTVNGSIVSNGTRAYDIDVDLKDCYLDEDGGLEGSITYRGSASETTATEMNIEMKHLRIGLYLLDEMTADMTIRVENNPNLGSYKSVLNGMVAGLKEAVTFSDFSIAVEKDAAGAPQYMDGRFDMTRSMTPCLVGGYEVSTVTPLADGGKIRVNNAEIVYQKEGGVHIDYQKGSVTLVKRPELHCP